MHEEIKQMLKKYFLRSEDDYSNALKEIFQEIALLGLWRAKFFEKAAFYGGSALRILYGLDRFSEDLDFSLLRKSMQFDLTSYNKAIIKELNAFGFESTVETKVKSSKTNIESAFIKAESKKQFIAIEAPRKIIESMHFMQMIKIKMEVDTNPPGLFNTESKFLFQPIAFSIRSFIESDLFSGKVHAILCRPWIKRIKGRDWYDFVWYVSRNTPLNLAHLKERLVQSEAWERKKPLTKNNVIELLSQKIQTVDLNEAKKDVIPFIQDHARLAVWSKQFFMALLEKLRT
ncbi:MAG: hypothetical protein A3I77_05270 [Gammaproteobacteria bacterium RIFCSPLOWO2_02_FULL_42_14]|nr:MAG: hypothetical protein A3B71_01835 [Gammaproteobacteria bacterium RIFCSPHIGHO2_02_FULL_42_43]OGT51184.1 MAG: hypothetical protein A3E54_03025 [Gammaproteobacteria bacterium RIFCSPHIGHO2_12_FULL_41_25]OGT62946.1 MAG: hypothetical protein A3I77_05270 [Gammaproteobacteria bacterium RIFCSPLOWO2_02_FULL_42_14]OGT86078.1 MAG: hypothetical protein A3G86_02825 [Gammaproteobacteria bacterium RIFCSPLOWO2_12_FULL_42_18]